MLGVKQFSLYCGPVSTNKVSSNAVATNVVSTNKVSNKVVASNEVSTNKVSRGSPEIGGLPV